jgi:hypothetical protein
MSSNRHTRVPVDTLMSVFANKEDRRQLRGIIAAMLVEPDTLRTKATRHANAPSGGKGQKKDLPFFRQN